MMIIDFIKRAFFEPKWKLAAREINNESPNFLSHEKKLEYNGIVCDKNGWYADPFICSENEKLYIFFEYYINKKGKGTIAVGEYKNNQIFEVRIIIEKNYHMSYPCVFKYKSNFYMIPETADNKTIELYKAKTFPYDWELVNILKKDIGCVDLTVFNKGSELYAIGYRVGCKKKQLYVFQLDIENETITLIDEVKEDNIGRPAGNIIYHNGKLVRPAQICEKKYGEGIDFREIVSLSKGAYNERPLSKMEGKDIIIKGEKSIDRIHTINRYGNIEIIDYSCDSFNLFRPIKILLCRLKKI